MTWVFIDTCKYKTKPNTKGNHKWDLRYYRYIHVQINILVISENSFEGQGKISSIAIQDFKSEVTKTILITMCFGHQIHMGKLSFVLNHFV